MVFSTTLVIIFLSIGTSYIFLRNNYEMKNEASFQQIEYISDHLSTIMESSENYTKTIVSNADVQQYMNYALDNPLKRHSIKNDKRMQQLILQIIQSTPFIHSITLYATDNTPLISTEPYSKNYLKFPLPTAPSWVVREKQDLISSREKISVLSLQSPFYATNSGKLIGYVEISVPESAISNIYRKVATEDQVLMIDKDGIIQSCTTKSSLHTKYPLMKGLTFNQDRSCQLSNSHLVFYQYFPALQWYIIDEVPLITFLRPLIVLLFISFLLMLFAIILYIGISHVISSRITAPLQYLVFHIKQMQGEELHTINEIPCTSEVNTLVHSFNKMILSQNELQQTLLQAETRKRDLALSLLQEQINPHFLYNTLDNICSLAELDEKETLIQLVMSLSSFYRSSLSNGKMHITLGQELQIAQSYLEILYIRYPNKFTYHISCPEELKSCSCIKLLLQPILENSIYHGIKELGRMGTIHITCTSDGADIQIVIQDNGIGLTPEQLTSIWAQENDHFGIKNIHQRIQLYYGESYGLCMSIPKEGGCKTTIIIPKKEAIL